MSLRARRGSGTPLFAFGGPCLAAQSVLRRAQPHLCTAEELPHLNVDRGTADLAGAILLAPPVLAGGAGECGAFPRRRKRRAPDALVRLEGSRGRAGRGGTAVA